MVTALGGSGGGGSRAAEAKPVGASTGGLAPGRTYRYRLVAGIPAGNTYESDRTFLTAPLTAPPVETGGAVARREQAELSGTVDPQGNPVTSCLFEYGETEAYGLIAQCTSSPEGEGPKAVSATLKKLEEGTTYHYRLVAANSAGTSYGSDRTFTTTPLIAPPVNTSFAEPGSEIAELVGGVDPEHHPLTSCQFEYGETEAYGEVSSQCAPVSEGGGEGIGAWS